MGDNTGIRPYRPEDRDAVRRICRDTAERGRPWPAGGIDPELLVDLLTRYYTDIDSRWNWVVETSTGVTGYVLAAADTRAFRRAMAWRIVPMALAQALCRGSLFSRPLARMVRVGLHQRGRDVRPDFPIPPGYPAHLHINLLDAHRGQGLGGQLIGRSAAQLRAAGIAGVHATVRADNPGACRFFERMDFKPLSHYDVILPSGRSVQSVRIVVYGRRLANTGQA